MAAAMAVMAELGPRRMTVAEVARRAGVSRMTVYRRYATLDGLVAAALTAEFGELLEQAAAASDGTGRERVMRETLSVATALLDHSLLRSVLEVDPGSVLPLLVQRLGSGQRLILGRLAELIRAGIDDGSIRDADADRMALVVLAMAQSFVVGMAALSQHQPEEALLAELGRAVDRYLEGNDDQTR